MIQTTPRFWPYDMGQCRNIGEMFEISVFPGDADEILKEFQLLIHFDLIRHLAMEAKERYVEAADFLGTDNELASWARPQIFIDPCGLRLSYSMIAAAYRFYHGQQGQMQLGQNPKDYYEAVKSGWVEFFQAETKRLTKGGRVTRAILETCRYFKTPESEDAEERLTDLLGERYGNLKRRAEKRNRERLERLLQPSPRD